MITIQQVQLKILQQRVISLQADKIISSQQIYRLRKRLIQLQDYQIKYQLLLQKGQQDSSLHRSRRKDEIQHMTKKLTQNDEKWQQKLKLQQQKNQQTIEFLEKQNNLLIKQINQIKSNMGLKSTDRQSQVDNIWKFKIKELEAENHSLNDQLMKFQIQMQNKLEEFQQGLDTKIVQAKNSQKQFYRQNIIQLQNTIKQQEQQISFHKQRASPQRQKQIQRLNFCLRQLQISNAQQIVRLTQLIQQKQNQFQQQHNRQMVQKQQASKLIRSLSQQLQLTRNSLTKNSQSNHNQLLSLRLQLSSLYQSETQKLKQSFNQLELTHQHQRQQWSMILKEQEEEVQRVKNMWDEEKDKYLHEKDKLKQKIKDLKDRLNIAKEQYQSKNKDNQTYKLIQSIKQIDQNQNQFNDYQSGVIFLHRQLKRSTTKIQQKQRQIKQLMQQQKQQCLQYQQQLQIQKQQQRQHTQKIKQKLHRIQTLNLQLMEQIRKKDQQSKQRQKQFQLKKLIIQQENHKLLNIIQEMERDYQRLNINKKDLDRSYRSQRDNVFTGKLQINQQKKTKRLQLDRQRSQLEIVYKEREKQIRQGYQLKFMDIQQKLLKEKTQNEQNKLKLSNIKQNISPQQQRIVKQGLTKELTKKQTSLDLQISLSKNLLTTLKNLHSRTNPKTQLNQLSQQQSESITSRQRKIQQLQDISLDQNDFVRENIAPTFSNNRGFQRQYERSIDQDHTEMQISFHPRSTTNIQ